MTATTCDNGSALLRTVLADPASDDARLILADWYEENGQADRGEFVRVQCELAATDDPHSDRYWDGQLDKGPESYRRRKALRQRGRDLFRGEWAAGVSGLTVLSGGPPLKFGKLGGEPFTTPPCESAVWSRGFVAKIRLPLAAFLTHARDLFSRHPVTAVVLTDREPEQLPADSVRPRPYRYWHWPTEYGEMTPWNRLVNWITAKRLAAGLGGYQHSREAALSDMSMALVGHGREWAGLPPLG